MSRLISQGIASDPGSHSRTSPHYIASSHQSTPPPVPSFPVRSPHEHRYLPLDAHPPPLIPRAPTPAWPPPVETPKFDPPTDVAPLVALVMPWLPDTICLLCSA